MNFAWQWPQRNLLCICNERKHPGSRNVLTHHLRAIPISGSEGRSSLKWLFFILRWGERRSDASRHGAIHSTFWPRRTNTAQHLPASANWNMPPCCWEAQVCVCVCVCVAIHSIRMPQHTPAVHCQRCPLRNLGQPRSLHYHINYIHVVAAVWIDGIVMDSTHWTLAENNQNK